MKTREVNFELFFTEVNPPTNQEEPDWIIFRIILIQEKYHPTLSDPSTTTTPLTPSSFNLFATVIPAIPLVKDQNLEDSIGI